jgi:hypothetical protein
MQRWTEANSSTGHVECNGVTQLNATYSYMLDGRRLIQLTKKVEKSIVGNTKLINLHAKKKSNFFYYPAIYDKISQILF